MGMRLVQFLFGAAIVLFGAYLIGRWAIGVALAILGLIILFDGLLHNLPTQSPKIEGVLDPLKEHSIEEIIEHARRTP